MLPPTAQSTSRTEYPELGVAHELEVGGHRVPPAAGQLAAGNQAFLPDLAVLEQPRHSGSPPLPRDYRAPRPDGPGNPSCLRRPQSTPTNGPGRGQNIHKN